MSHIAAMNLLTDPKGIRPFGPISVRWSRTRKDWCATNTIERGWNSRVYLSSARLADVLGRLDVRVVGIRCDEHSMYYLCEPGAIPMADRPCGERVELQVIRRPCNGLNIEFSGATHRCRLKAPKEWAGTGVTALRWLGSGGSPLVLGTCSNDCPRFGPEEKGGA